MQIEKFFAHSGPVSLPHCHLRQADQCCNRPDFAPVDVRELERMVMVEMYRQATSVENT
jgi:hypothetical protein